MYTTAKGGNTSGVLPGVKTRYLFIYGARKETSVDAIKTLLMEKNVTLFSVEMVSNELKTIRVRYFNYPDNKLVPIMEIKMSAYNCRGFNLSTLPVITKLLNDCDIFLIQET